MQNFQGFIRVGGGVTINGPVDLQFRIYDAASAGNLVDMDGDGAVEPVIGQDVKQVLGVMATGGVLSTKFGPVSAKAFNGFSRWLEVSVNGTPLTRIEMVTSLATAEQINRPFTGTSALNVDGLGNIGIGTATPLAKLDVAGTTRTDVLQIDAGADLAELFVLADDPARSDAVHPGMVVVIDADRSGRLTLSRNAYDRKVAGVISGANDLNPGMVMKASGHAHGDGDILVALTGRVWCWADAASAPISPGDRLTTSDTPGHAMKAADNERAVGAVIGKAMTSLAEGRGLVLVLIQPQ